MPGRPFNSVIPLPKQWNKRVRSAVLHVVSLAHLALSTARAQAIERHRARTHCFCELDRLWLLKTPSSLFELVLETPLSRTPYFK